MMMKFKSALSHPFIKNKLTYNFQRKLVSMVEQIKLIMIPLIEALKIQVLITRSEKKREEYTLL